MALAASALQLHAPASRERQVHGLALAVFCNEYHQPLVNYQQLCSGLREERWPAAGIADTELSHQCNGQRRNLGWEDFNLLVVKPIVELCPLRFVQLVVSNHLVLCRRPFPSGA